MIIDLHAHTTEHALWNLHTASASIATLESEARQNRVSTIVLMATYFPLKGTGVHNADLLERIKGRPLFKMFGSLDVMNHLDSGLQELESLAEAGQIAGIKLYPGYQAFAPDESRIYGIYRLAQQYNLPVMFHGGELHHCCSPSAKEGTVLPCGAKVCKLDKYGEMVRPEHVERPARDFHDVKFVVSHLANPYFEELREVMNRCPNVSTDISGQFVSGSPENTEDYRRLVVSEIRQFLELPDGIGRVMFATDFPIQSYQDSLDLISRLRLTARERECVCALNAQRVLDKKFRPKRRLI